MMYSNGVDDGDEGPAVLQLRRWSRSNFQIELSEFKEALISPAKDLLVLLSRRSEAVLLPLSPGVLHSCPSEKLEESSSFSLDSLKKAVLNDAHCSVISDAKSLVWGHSGDSYKQHKEPFCRELLFVSNGNDVIVHAFFSPRENAETANQPLQDGILRGSWVDWGPVACNRQAQEQFEGKSHPKTYVTNMFDGKDECSPSGKNSTQKKYLQSFFAQLDTCKSEGKFLGRFPGKESLPFTAEVVSFSIFGSTLTFLEESSRNFPISDKNNGGEETRLDHASVQQDPSSIGADAYSDPPSNYSGAGFFSQHCADEVEDTYKCSKIFGSFSHQLVGLLLTCTHDGLMKTAKGNMQGRSQTSVVVVMVHDWGIWWVCTVDIGGSFQGPDMAYGWADLQFSGSFLVCLYTSGLINVWDTKTGRIVTHLHALQGLDPKAYCQPDHLGALSPVGRRSDGKKFPEHGCGKICFRRIIVSSCPMLFAVIDEHGVIYITHAEGCISQDTECWKNFPCQDPLIEALSGWKVAGTDINHQKMNSEVFTSQDQNFSSANGGRPFILSKSKGYSYLSSFASAQRADCQLSPFGLPSIHRRVFLPCDGYNMDDSICFSPFGITWLIRGSDGLEQNHQNKLVHNDLHVASVFDERDFVRGKYTIRSSTFRKESTIVGEAIGCCFKGSLYLVKQEGLFVVLPSLLSSLDIMPAETIRYWQPGSSTGSKQKIEYCLMRSQTQQLWNPCQIEILDKIILNEGPDEADSICLENGWDLTISRIRQIQLALHYEKTNEIERFLDMLADVNLAEEGILRLIFTSVYQIFCKLGGDSEVAEATRMLSLAACFATKMVRRYGFFECEKENANYSLDKDQSLCQHQDSQKLKIDNLRRLEEMAYFLEIIRNIQCRVIAKRRNLSQIMDDKRHVSELTNKKSFKDESQGLTMEGRQLGGTDAFDNQNKEEAEFVVPDLSVVNDNKLELVAMGSSHPMNVTELAIFATEDGKERRRMIPSENHRDMIARWGMEKFDLSTVVRDALCTDRLPLAVLQLHLQRSKVVTGRTPQDTFSEIRDVGKAIAYDLFLKGESKLAITALQRLGEDIEVCLRQLLFSTLRRSVRTQIAKEIKSLGFLKFHESATLERITLIERLYPSSSFWETYLWRCGKHTECSSGLDLSEKDQLLLNVNLMDNLSIHCGDVDGVVTGSWANADKDPAVAFNHNDAHAGYWACAVVWSDAWDLRTIDRIMLDQPHDIQIDVPWETELDYHMSHNDWQEVVKILDVIPASSLSKGMLIINVDASYSNEDLEPVCLYVPNVRVLNFSVSRACSSQMKMLMEQVLAKKFIFLKEFWESSAEIVPLLSRSGLIVCKSKISSIARNGERDKAFLDIPLSDISGSLHQDTRDAFHKLVIHHCSRYNLPNFLELYLDHHKVALDKNSLSLLLGAAEGCQWAKWLLFLRVKGCEYDASFCNARSILPQTGSLKSSLNIMDVDEILQTVDDMAEGGGEIAAIATLIYAPVPVQKCLCFGSVSRRHTVSFQCTLENLRHGLQRFPTLWRTLVSACLGQDTYDYPLSPRANSVFGKSDFADYLKWRDNLFSSAGGDTSLAQMLPYWFPKPVRRMIKLFLKGPLVWQPLSDDLGFVLHANENTRFNAISWEAAIQRNVEELYSSRQEKIYGIEHYQHRGRPLAAFSHILDLRIQEIKSADFAQEAPEVPSLMQANIQSDVQKLLEPCNQKERSFISSVIPLGIMHFEDPVLVSSCTFLLELCGFSASMLCLDVAVLRRISSYYKSIKSDAHLAHVFSRGSSFHAVPQDGDLIISLARILADNYLQQENFCTHGENFISKVESIKKPSRDLMSVLQHLEKASLPLLIEDQTCGSWLSSGVGDGHELRAQQKAASQYWNLVTTFCHVHHLPPSLKYLAVLAKDNDWVGFLVEAQIEKIPLDMIIQLVDKDFSDPRLKMHLLTVLKSMKIRKANSTSTASTEKKDEFFSNERNKFIPAELFKLVALCEKQKNPGEALLAKAKDLRWPLLAMVASCFPDVSSLLCLTVWLEISAARETSSIQVNDSSSQMARNVGAAVEATNTLFSASKTLAIHYNRKNPKRRRLLDESKPDVIRYVPSDIDAHRHERFYIAQDTEIEWDRQVFTMQVKSSCATDEGLSHLSHMVAVLSEQRLFHPLLKAFEMFLPSCPLLPFIRSLQAFSQMRLSEASAHLLSFSVRIKEESFHTNSSKDEQLNAAWISSAAVKAADAVLKTCPSPYEKRCLLKLLAGADFGDGGYVAGHYRRLLWKINLVEPLLRKNDGLLIECRNLDDASLLMELEKNGHWEEARNWAKQLESIDVPWSLSVHHVTEMQAEAMVAEWKEFLWDIPEERSAMWSNCQTLFTRYSFPALQAGKFFLRHAEVLEKDITARELHEMLLLSLQWLSGLITLSSPVYPLHLLREIETRIWLLAVESEVQYEAKFNSTMPSPLHSTIIANNISIIEHTASIISKMDNHLSLAMARTAERNITGDGSQLQSRFLHGLDPNTASSSGTTERTKRKIKNYQPFRRSMAGNVEPSTVSDNYPSNLESSDGGITRVVQVQEENLNLEVFSGWEERVQPAELERAVLSLLEFGQVAAAKQLQQKLSPEKVPSELFIVEAALKLASASSRSSSGTSVPLLEDDVITLLESSDALNGENINQLKGLEILTTRCSEGCGRGLCKRIIAVLKAAKVLCIPFLEAFEKNPIELLQLLSLKAQESLEEARLLVQTHVIPPASIAHVLAESFLKGLLAAHRGGYIDSQTEEGPAPLLWRFTDFLKWAELCPSESEIGHALMRLVITSQEIPHACEVELLILSHHFYKSSACLDGVDVLVTLAANRVESYVSEGDFACLARLVTGVSNFHALDFILGILVENGQLELVLQKYSAVDPATCTSEAVTGFRMAILTSLKQFNPDDLDALAMVYSHFDMKHESAALLETRSNLSLQQWYLRSHRYPSSEDLFESMLYLIEAADVYSTLDAGQKAHDACSRASLISLQIRIPDFAWLHLSETNSRRVLVEQSHFEEAFLVAEAYNLNQAGEWALVLWNQLIQPDFIEKFVSDFVAVLPLWPSMLLEIARFLRAEVAARGDRSYFPGWGTPTESKLVQQSFRSLLSRTRDLRLRMQLATIATGFPDIIKACNNALDKVPDHAGPLILRRGHGGTYLPII